jgi:hypothetical protein
VPHGLTRPTPLFTVKNGAASAPAVGTFAVRPNSLMRLYRRRVRHDWPPHVNLGSGLLSDHLGGKVVARIGGLCKLLTHRGHKPGRNPAVQRALT